MRSSLFAVALVSSLSSTVVATTCVNDVCQQLFQKYGSAYCTLYKEISDSSGLPSWMGAWKDTSISSACACIKTSSTKSSSSTAKTSSVSSSTSKCSASTATITSISTVTAVPSVIYSTVVSTIISLTTVVSTEIDVSTFASTEVDYLTTTIIPPAITAYVTVPTTVTVSTCPATSSTSLVISSTTFGTTSVPTSSTSSTPVPCTATAYSMIAPAVAACTAITLQDISAPTNSTIVLTGLKAGTVVTFAGTTTFAFTNISTFDPITIGGAGITVQGAPGHVIEGNGAAYWDGIGSNGGVPKPNHFIAMSKVTKNSVIKNLYIKNYPVHCFSISGCSDVVMDNITLDNSAGNAPNAVSNGLPAGHNSDGFDLSTCNNFVLQNSWVSNQDDCVAVTSGNNITIANMYCNGGHGMSIGSVGGKSNNNVTNITFKDSVILNSTNGPRIKTNYNTTGFISNITYSNIAVSNIATYGIDIQEDYLNGGPTGTPTNGVIISNLLFSNVTGTAITGAQDYYILCGDGSCSNFVFDNVAITGGTVAASCNYPATGCPGP